jgi:hypothetical protein
MVNNNANPFFLALLSIIDNYDRRTEPIKQHHAPFTPNELARIRACRRNFGITPRREVVFASKEGAPPLIFPESPRGYRLSLGGAGGKKRYCESFTSFLFQCMHEMKKMHRPH